MPTFPILSLLGVLAAAPAWGETPAELIPLPEPAGLGRLVRPAGPAGAPLVIMLPDALGEDGRAEPYVDSLLARGIASLVLGLGEDLDALPSPVDPAASPAAIEPAMNWARAAGFLPGQVFVMGFGLGGRAALAGADAQPAVALYPGCGGLALPSQGPALVLQGAEVAEGCAALRGRPGLDLRLLPGAGHAWDAPGAIWPSPGPMLPDPADGTRRQAHADPAVTLAAAELVADWVEDRLLAGRRRAAR